MTDADRLSPVEQIIVLSDPNPPNAQTHANIIVRNATLQDLDNVASVLASAFAGSPAWNYGYQFRKISPEYHLYCLRKDIRQQFLRMDVQRTWAKVLELRDPDRDGQTEVVSVAVWKLLDQRGGTDREGGLESRERSLSSPWMDFRRITTEAAQLITGDDESGSATEPFDCSLHLDANITRLNDFQQQLQIQRRPYIEDAYPVQLYLEELATHPHWQGHGYAEQLVRWGMSEAQRRKLGPVTLVSTPAGHDIYRRLGFIDLGEVLVRRLDGAAKLWFEAMRWGM